MFYKFVKLWNCRSVPVELGIRSRKLKEVRLVQPNNSAVS